MSWYQNLNNGIEIFFARSYGIEIFNPLINLLYNLSGSPCETLEVN
jgi:hypothetical protein